MNDAFKISGYIKLYEFPQNYTYDKIRNLSDEQKDEFLVDAGKNLIVDTGLTQIVDLMVGTDTSSFTHCRVGSGTNTPTNADTDMQTIIDSGVTVTPLSIIVCISVSAFVGVFVPLPTLQCVKLDVSVPTIRSTICVKPLSTTRFLPASTKNTSF